MTETLLTSALLEPVTVITHNNYKTVILRQGRNAITLTNIQISKLGDLYFQAIRTHEERKRQLAHELEAVQVEAVQEEQKRKKKQAVRSD